MLTSGTTGEPRAVVFLHRNLMASVRSAQQSLNVQANDVFVSWAPMYYGLGLLRFVFGPMYFGCPCHFVQPSMANLRRWLETIGNAGATITGGPDYGFRVAAATVDPQGIDLSSLRFAICSGEPIRRETIEQFEDRFGVPGVIRPGYGLSEANGVCVLAPGAPGAPTA